MDINHYCLDIALPFFVFTLYRPRGQNLDFSIGAGSPIKLSDMVGMNEGKNEFLSNKRYEGKWTGRAEDIEVGVENIESLFTYNATFSTKVDRNRFQMTGEVISTPKDVTRPMIKVDFNAVGFLFHNKAHVTYKLTSADVNGFGVMIISFTHDGSAFGYFLSHRITAQGYGFGRIRFTKN